MAMLGWLIVTVVGAFFALGGIFLVLLGPSFNGKINGECFIPVVVGGALLWWSYTAAPFEVMFK